MNVEWSIPTTPVGEHGKRVAISSTERLRAEAWFAENTGRLRGDTPMPERCEHGVASCPALGNFYCSGCRVGLISKQSIYTPPSVDSFNVVKPARYKWAKDTTWSGTPAIPISRSYVSQGCKWSLHLTDTGQHPATPHRSEGSVRSAILMTLPTHTPEGVCTKWGKLVPDCWHPADVSDAAAIRRAFDQYTRTSLDKGFKRTGESRLGLELNSDGDDTAPFEPTMSATMGLPSVEEIVEHVVIYPDGGRKSYFERETTAHHDPDMLTLLPSDYQNEELGASNTIDLLVLFRVAEVITQFDLLDHDGHDLRDERIAAYIRRTSKGYTLPSAGSFTSELDERIIRMRLRRITAHMVRTMRERCSATRLRDHDEQLANRPRFAHKAA